MASRLKQIREYWQATADTCEKLIVSPPKPEAVVLNYAAKAEVEVAKPANDLIPATAELINERAYILAIDMNLPLEWAEAIVKLQATGRPKNIPLEPWQNIEKACNQLYRDDFGLLKLIITHEWQLQDIFGCHPIASMTRFDVMGLLLLLRDNEIVGVNRERIKILHKSGSVTRFTHRLDQTSKVALLHESAIRRALSKVFNS